MDRFKGIFCATLTPFDDNDNIDLAFVTDHIKFLEEGGVQGIVVSGTNGEAASMRLDERKRLIEHCAKNKRSLPMVAGTGTCCLPETIELTKFAESVGADAAMVLPPFFFPNAPTEGLIEPYNRVFDSVSFPIFLYNIPGPAGFPISDEIVHALEHYPHLAGIKDSSGNLESTLHFVKTFPKLRIFVGSDLHVLAVLKAGGVGHITGLPNAFPSLTTALYRAFAEGEDATEQQARVAACREALRGFMEFGIYKYVLSRKGFSFRHCRLPLLDTSDEELAKFEKLMRAEDLWSLVEG